MKEDPTKTDIGVNIESLNDAAKEFEISLLFAACVMPSTEPSVSPVECIDDSSWYWDVGNGYGCAQVSGSFCDNLSTFWHNGKNSLSACCVCGGGAHI